MVDLLNSKDFEIHEITDNEIMGWVKSEYHGTHPESLVSAAFPAHVMEAVCSDHHKSRDGVLTISYDYWTRRWHFAHPGYG